MQYGALSLFLFRDFMNYQARNLNFYYLLDHLPNASIQKMI